MASYASGAGEARSAAIHHTLQRHTEILQDYRQEFNKTSSNIASMIEREELLSSVQTEFHTTEARMPETRRWTVSRESWSTPGDIETLQTMQCRDTVTAIIQLKAFICPSMQQIIPLFSLFDWSITR